MSVITLSITAECLSIDSENLLFKKLTAEYSDHFPDLIERSRYNRRRRHLADYIEVVRKSLANQLVPYEDTFILDSMPLEVCKLARSKRSTICSENYSTAPNWGYCASHSTFFYGYKLHGVCSLNGVVTSVDISKASVADVRYLQDLKHQYSDCLVLGDKGYLCLEDQINLFETARIRLETPMRSNQKNYRKQPYVYRKMRKRIETIFSQLCDQFMIRRNYAKTFQGFKTRLLSKITAFTILQYLNKFYNNRPINHVKHALAN
ncbi:IS982 family transposase ISFba2 [subsurface metagenome]